MTINILKTESFLPLGPAIRKPVAEKPYVPEKVRPGVFRDQQGRLYTDIATPGVPQVPKPTPLPTLPNALPDENGWIDCSSDMPDIPERGYQLRHRFLKYIKTPGEKTGFTGEFSLRRNVNTPEAIRCHQYRLTPKAS